MIASACDVRQHVTGIIVRVQRFDQQGDAGFGTQRRGEFQVGNEDVFMRLKRVGGAANARHRVNQPRPAPARIAECGLQRVHERALHPGLRGVPAVAGVPIARGRVEQDALEVARLGRYGNAAGRQVIRERYFDRPKTAGSGGGKTIRERPVGKEPAEIRR